MQVQTSKRHDAPEEYLQLEEPVHLSRSHGSPERTPLYCMIVTEIIGNTLEAT